MAKKMGQARAALPAALPLAAGLVLRLWMLKSLFQVNGDMLIYGDLAKNLLLHGSFALTLPSGAMYPTLIRLPGYPLFLAACFRVFGMENYFAAACVQIALELLGCLLLADFVRRIAPAPGEPRSSAGDALAGGALPLHRLLHGGSAHRDAHALCAGAGDVGDGALPGTSGLGQCAVVYLRGHLRRAVAARRRAGGRSLCAGAC